MKNRQVMDHNKKSTTLTLEDRLPVDHDRQDHAPPPSGGGRAADRGRGRRHQSVRDLQAHVCGAFCQR